MRNNRERNEEGPLTLFFYIRDNRSTPVVMWLFSLHLLGYII